MKSGVLQGFSLNQHTRLNNWKQDYAQYWYDNMWQSLCIKCGYNLQLEEWHFECLVEGYPVCCNYLTKVFIVVVLYPLR